MKQKLLSIFMLCTLLVSVAFAQNKTITGKVTSSDNGETLPGVSVVVQGTTVGTQTDVNGNYTLSVPNSATTLRFSFIGYLAKDITIGSENTINVSLDLDASELGEVVVVGYGTGRPLSTVVGSVAKVSSEDIKGKPTANALESLQGKVAGLQVYTGNGEPSATQSIRLHGSGSLGASSTPLYVLDGIPVGSGSIVSMNPEDFESVTVLKDASATSIYGSRAANGVIYFTTKKGKIGETATITARAQYGISNLAQTKAQDKLMTTAQLQQFWLETGEIDQAGLDKINETYGGNDTRWYKTYYKEDVPIKQFDLNISGGTNKTQYYISAGFLDQEGVMYRSGFDRTTLRSNISSRLNDWAKVGLNLAGGIDKRETNGWGSNNTNGGLALLALPWYSPLDEDGNPYYDKTIPGWGRYHPQYLADMYPVGAKNQQFNPNAFVELTPLDGLTIRSQAGMDYFHYRYSSRRLPSYAGAPGAGTAREYWQQGVARTITNTAEYKFQLDDVHDIAFLVGQEYSDYKEDYFNAEGTGLTDDRLTLLGSVTSGQDVDQTFTEYAYNSFFGRASYGYNGKYYFDATIRQDESSRFGAENRTAVFWSVGGLWNAKKESFLNDVTWLTDLRVRASIGTSGNSDIDNYLSLATVGNSIYNGGTSWGVSAPGNPQLAWEEQTKATVGFTARLVDRISLDVEGYNRVTKNMLVDVPFPYTSGFAEVTSNVGALQNRGVDVNLSVDVFLDRDYYFTPYVNFNYNSEKVTELFQGKDYWIIPNTGVSWAVGKPVSFFYPIQAGVNPETGNMQWYLPGEDITESRQDPNAVTEVFNEASLQQSTGLKRYPPLAGGFGFATGYKGFYVNADFTFANGKYLINNDRFFYENPYNFFGFNQSEDVLDYWKEPGDVTKFPKYGSINQFDSGLIENASFLRLKTLQVGYQLPSNIIEKTGFFRSARVFYIGRNLFTVTDYLGADPEVSSNLAMGVNPNTKQSVFGIELQF